MSAASSTAPVVSAPVNRTLQWVVWAALGLIIAGIGVGFVRQQWKNMERRADVALDRFNLVPDFTLTERSGQSFSSATLHGKIWLADFFFTACPGPCLVMNGKMEAIGQALTRDHADVRQVSFSIAPQQDTPPVLRKYAARFHAPADRWSFLTGDEGTIYALASKAFLLPTVDNTNKPNRLPDEGEFIHSEKNRARGPRWVRAGLLRQHQPRGRPAGARGRGHPPARTARCRRAHVPGGRNHQDRHLNPDEEACNFFP